MTRGWLIAVVVAAGLVPRAARAEIERYALIIGNDTGDGDEQRLRYAEDDARRVYEVLRELGGFRPENMLMLRSEDAETARRSLISLNDRIRTQTASGAQSELLVYYSGHSDQAALHLGRSTMELVQLEELVRGSAATLRVLILDSCRSGALTRVKGGTIQPGFAVDRDGSGSVTLGEAYQYTYENTLRATSRTLSGTQHPTFHYELGGHGDVVLTVLSRPGDQRALISFPEDKSYLLIQGSADGGVVAEIGAHDRTRRLSVKPGRYFVRGRSPEFLLEGTLVLGPSEQHQVRDEELERIDYMRLARKGHLDLRHASSVRAGYALRTALWSGGMLCQGPFAGYAIDLGLVSLAPRVGVCRGGFGGAPGVTADELDVELGAAHTWHLGRLATGAGFSLGGSYLRQRTSNGDELGHDTLAHAGVLTSVTVDIASGFYSGIEVDAMSYFRVAAPHAISQSMVVRTSTAFALRLDMLLIGKHW